MVQESRSPIRLSHSSLLLLDSCPRCFWLRYNRGIFQPQGLWSGLPNRFDSIIKAYFNRYRPSGTLPPILQGKCQGRLEDPFVEDYTWRIKDGYVFVGKLDECLVTGKGRLVTVKKLHTPVDHKTTSTDPRNMEVLPAYGAQLDAYAFLLEKNGKKTTGYGHLIFYYPEHTDDLHEGCRLITDVKTLKTDPKRTDSAIKKAIEVIESPRPPLRSMECSFCGWYEKVAEEQSDRYSEIDAAGAGDAGVQRRASSAEKVGRNSEEMIPGVRTPIANLRDGLRGVKVEGTIVKVEPPRVVSGNKTVAHALLEDKSGTITLVLWDKQIDDVAKGSKIGINGAYVKSWSGEKQLHAGRTGVMVSLGKKANSTSPTAESQPQRKGATSWISQNPNTRYANGNLSWWAEQARKGHVIEWEMDKNRYTGRVRLDGHILSREAARKSLMQ